MLGRILGSHALPLLDTLSVIVLRLRAGSPPWVGDRRHISHRLVRRGLRAAVVVTILWAASAVCGLAAVALPMVGVSHAPILLVGVGVVLAVLIVAAGSDGLS